MWLNALHLSGPTYWIYGLLEVDVTIPRRWIAEHEAQTGEKISFTGFLVCCLARAVDENKEVQAYLKGRKQFVIFDDVNEGVTVEHRGGEKGTLMGLIIDGANHKTCREIHGGNPSGAVGIGAARQGMPHWFLKAMLLPWPFSSLVKFLMAVSTRWEPAIRVAAAGTVMVTAVGMFGKGTVAGGLQQLHTRLAWWWGASPGSLL